MILNTDGGARGNPGPGACAYVLKNLQGNVVAEGSTYLGVCTNNEAEYQGLILGLEHASKEATQDLEILMDSELVVKQLKGLYRVKEPRLQKLFQQVETLEKKFSTVNYLHIPREKNTEADKLVNKELDAQTKETP
jgi:ribonuclease HI